jgi:hypothetical protein
MAGVNLRIFYEIIQGFNQETPEPGKKPNYFFPKVFCENKNWTFINVHFLDFPNES